MKSRTPRTDGPGAVELIEEAITLLREASPVVWAIYLSGAVPWVLGFGYFWASASWFSPRPVELLWQALALTALYLGLKVAQAEFCARLRAIRLERAPAPASWSSLRRTATRQARSQGWAAPIMPIAAILSVPVGVAWMYFENLTALATTPDPEGERLETRARREAMRWPGPAHLALLLFSGLWLCVWLNVASAFYVLPWLARTLLGLDTIFGLSGWTFLNGTFLALVSILTWLAVDPLVKSYHVLRTFYGEARQSGEDLRLELGGPSGPETPAAGAKTHPTRGGKGGGALRAALLGLGLLWLAGTGPGNGLRAADEAAAVSRIEITDTNLDSALDAALQNRDFRWRLAPLPALESGQTDGWLKTFVREGVETLLEIARWVRDLAQDFADWLENLFKKKDKEKPPVKERAEWGDFAALTRGLLYALLVLCAVALLWLGWITWKQRQTGPRPLSTLSAAPPAPPDLNDEKLEASRLPPDEWLELARRQIAQGEWRLALRALYLATLASLGAQGLVTLARAKTNLDYERELTRRAAGRTELVAMFRARRLAFECVWYGRAVAEQAQVDTWLKELDRARTSVGGQIP